MTLPQASIAFIPAVFALAIVTGRRAWSPGGGFLPARAMMDAGPIAVARRLVVAPARRGVYLAAVGRLWGDFSTRGAIPMRRDIAEREVALAALRESEERLRVLFDHSPVALLVFDRELRVTECNDRMIEILRVPREDLVGTRLSAANSSSLVSLCEAALGGESRRYDGPFEFRPGEKLWLEGKVSALRSLDGVTSGMLVAWDVTDARRAVALFDRLAFHDTLTSLPNRTLLRDRLRVALDDARRSRTSVALGVLNVDRFKTVNEAVGHRVADALLQELAGRLSGVVRRGDTLARVGGDEFGLIIPNIRGSHRALAIGEKILAAVRDPLPLGGRTLSVTGSLGVALYPHDADDAYALIQTAERALRGAREAGGDRQQLYDAAMNREAVERLTIEQGLRTALEENQLVVYFEPQVDLRDGRVLGVEALVRWNHPEKGIVAPDAILFT